MIRFKCHKSPESTSSLEGFTKGNTYIGRSFNGFYQISAKWGSGMQTAMLNQQQFEQYFELEESAVKPSGIES